MSNISLPLGELSKARIHRTEWELEQQARAKVLEEMKQALSEQEQARAEYIQWWWNVLWFRNLGGCWSKPAAQS